MKIRKITALLLSALIMCSACASTTEKTDVSPEIDYVDEYGYTYYKNPTVWTTEDIFDNLIINGRKYEAPLTLEKLGDEYSYSSEDGFYDSEKRIACLRLLCNDKYCGFVYFDDCNSIDDVEEKEISSFHFGINTIDEEILENTSFVGLTVNSSKQDVLDAAGIPACTYDDLNYLMYARELPYSEATEAFFFIEARHNEEDTLLFYINLK